MKMFVLAMIACVAMATLGHAQVCQDGNCHLQQVAAQNPAALPAQGPVPQQFAGYSRMPVGPGPVTVRVAPSAPTVGQRVRRFIFHGRRGR